MNTSNLFASLIKHLHADCVCDVGSLDGTQAVRFAHLLPKAHVFAFEANPQNYRRMRQNGRLERLGIEVLPNAVSDIDGMVGFHVADVDYDSDTANKGLSGLLVRDDPVRETVDVASVRLDTFLSRQSRRYERIALWIDVEGAGYSVIEGCEGIAGRVAVMHIEVETRRMWPGHRTKDEIAALLARWGFREIASQYWWEGTQGNSVVVNSSAARCTTLDIGICTAKSVVASAAGACIEPLRRLLYRYHDTRLYTLLKRIYLRGLF